MSGHTPGPWVVDAGKPLMVLAESGGFAVLISEAGRKVTTTDKANARLIAAAPDLLEAAKAMTEPAGEIAYRERWMALKAAIAKAEGR